MKNIKRVVHIVVISCVLNAASVFAKPKDINVLVVTGRANKYHNWQASSAAITAHLNNAGMFNVHKIEVSKAGESLLEFAPQWSEYAVVVLDYDGEEWPSSTKSSFVSYIKNGGGLVLLHASDNSFPNWQEFNDIIGLGGWGAATLHEPSLSTQGTKEGGSRNEKWGPRIYYYNGQLVKDNSPGGAFHPPRQDFIATTRNFEHPITKGMPENWLVSFDEIYSGLRGPAKNIEVLATGFANTDKGRPSAYHEPILFTVTYGKGRVFHSTLGHAGRNDDENTPSLRNVAFITSLLRGTEWAATGAVTQALPDDFPSVYQPSLRNIEKPDLTYTSSESSNLDGLSHFVSPTKIDFYNPSNTEDLESLRPSVKNDIDMKLIGNKVYTKDSFTVHPNLFHYKAHQFWIFYV